MSETSPDKLLLSKLDPHAELSKGHDSQYIIESNRSGNWSDPDMWTLRPKTLEDGSVCVIIRDGHEVILDCDTRIGDYSVEKIQNREDLKNGLYREVPEVSDE